MNVSVELTLSPLQTNFEPIVIDFIKALRSSGLTIKENPLSTQVYGSYDEVMTVLNQEMEAALEAIEHGLIYLKIVKSDRSNYKADF